MKCSARRMLPLMLLCGAVLISGCGIMGRKTADGRRIKRWSDEWYDIEAQKPVGARQVEHAGLLWPPYARPTGEKMEFSHMYHFAHYWPYPFNCQDRDFVRALSAQQVRNGWISHCTLYQYHFHPETHLLNNSGILKLRWILEHAPQERRTVSVQSGESSVVSEKRLAAVHAEASRIVGETDSIPIALRLTEPLGRPAMEVDVIRRGELESMPNPRITYTSVSGSGGGSSGASTP